MEPPALQYFPFWGFTVADGTGDSQTVLMPATPSALQGLQSLQLPAGATGGTRSVAGDAQVIEPEVPLDTARGWLSEQHPQGTVTQTVLYHLPLFRMLYSWRGQSYRAAVDGVSGQVYPADFPAKAEAPYTLVVILALLVFGLEGLIISNPVVKLLAYAVSSLPILAVAWWVSRKV